MADESQARPAPTSGRGLPYPNCGFHVQIEGVCSGAFTRVAIEPLRIGVIRFRDGSDLRERTVAGRPQTGRAALSRGVTGDTSLFRWWGQSRDGRPQRCTVTIMLLDELHQPAMRWVLHQAWPAAYELGKLDAEGEEPLLETVEVLFETMDIE